MNFDVIRFSKCPDCKKHGIPGFSKFAHGHNKVVSCKHCGGRFITKISTSLSFYMISGGVMAILACLVNGFIYPVPLWVWGIVMFFSFFVFEYFSPMVKAEKDEGSPVNTDDRQ